MPEEPSPAPSYQSLARYLSALGSDVRLQILHTVRRPKTLGQIRVQPGTSRAGGSPARAVSRQTVTHHLQLLEAEGLVNRVPAEHARFVLNHERLFAIVDRLHELARLQPIEAQPAGATLVRGTMKASRLPEASRLVVVYGREDGVAFPLSGPSGSRWHIGRASTAEIRLDYDPFLSSKNSWIERTSEGFLLHDTLGNRNGTWLNWRPLSPGGAARMAAGDVIRAGRSLLVFQAGPG